MPSIYDQTGMERLRRTNRIDPQAIRRFRTQLLKHFQTDEESLESFPAPDELQLHSLAIEQRFDSQRDGASKLLLRTANGKLIEAVILRIETGRTTLCVSSQVGCAAACEFCATGHMGIAQSLSADEILDQVLLAGQLLRSESRKVRNIVFMGMGEPFHNCDQVLLALQRLTSVELFHHPASRILVSSVGIVDGMLRCAEQFPMVNQALSLHSVQQEVRERIIPLAKRFPLPDLQATIQELNRLQPRPVMLEYLMLAGINDSRDDARLLAEWCTQLNVHLNLIPYNEIDDAPQLRGSSPDKIAEFSAILKGQGLKATTRYSLGADIAAACGQLVRRRGRR